MTDLERALSPDTPPAELLDLARRYPLDVANNPALDLLSFESPVLWHRIVARCRYYRAHYAMRPGIHALSKEGKLAWLRRLEERATVEHLDGDLRGRTDSISLQDYSGDLAQTAAREAVARSLGMEVTEIPNLARRFPVEYQIALAEEREWQLAELKKLLAEEGKEL